MIRIVLPAQLRELAQVGKEVELEVDGEITQRSVLDALEAAYPVLKGTIRDQQSKQRRAFVRYFACEEDLSLASPDEVLPRAVAFGGRALLRSRRDGGGLSEPDQHPVRLVRPSAGCRPASFLTLWRGRG